MAVFMDFEVTFFSFFIFSLEVVVRVFPQTRQEWVLQSAGTCNLFK